MIFFNSIRQSSENNILQICYHILNTFSVKYSKFHLNKLIESHVETNSLLAVKDIMREYGIESVAIRKGKYTYTDFETPFISSIQQEDWPNPNFTIVTDVTDQHVNYLDPIKNKNIKITLANFERIDKGIILLTDDSSKKDEADYAQNKNKENHQSFVRNIPMFIILSAIIITTIYHFSISFSPYKWNSLGFLTTSFIGLVITALLLWHDVDKHNPFIREVCGSSGKKINCDAVLSSAKSSFLGISWSVWGFSFMTTLFITQIIYAGQLDQLLITSYLSVAVAPYIIFSIYYQWRIIKQWCILCLVTQIILITNTIIGLNFINREALNLHQIDYLNIISTIFLGLMVLVSSNLAIPILKRANDSKNYESKWKRLRYNPEIFQSLLDNSDNIALPVDNIGIVIGNADAKSEIIKVCNPYCGPCSKAHPEIEHIIKNNKDVRLRIIFTATGNESDIKTNAVKLFLAVRDKYGEDRLKQLLDKWYGAESIKFENFEKEFNINVKEENYSSEILKMKNWCDKMKIRATPTIYINKKEMPNEYLISELKFLF